MTRVSARSLVAKAAREVTKASRHGIRLPSGPAVRTWKVSWDEIDAFFVHPTNDYLGRLRQAWKRRVPKTLGHVLPPPAPPDAYWTGEPFYDQLPSSTRTGPGPRPPSDSPIMDVLFHESLTMSRRRLSNFDGWNEAFARFRAMTGAGILSLMRRP